MNIEGRKRKSRRAPPPVATAVGTLAYFLWVRLLRTYPHVCVVHKNDVTLCALLGPVFFDLLLQREHYFHIVNIF